MSELGWLFAESTSTWFRVLTMEDYNTRIVVLGAVSLGVAAGLIGTFTLLRKRALLGDALAHATLPGIGMAFIMASFWDWNAKSLPLLLCGAAASGILGVAAISYLKTAVRLREDAALGIVLSVFFGAGVAILSVIQQVPNGRAAGLEGFIYGKTASLVAADAWLMLATAVGCTVICLLLFKEWKLLCFDEGFAGSRGYPTLLLDVVLMLTVVLVTIVGLQAVGQVLIIALLIIPAVSARFWTEHLGVMTVTAAVLGATSCYLGVVFSAVLPKLPSGPMIVLVAASLFAVSYIFGRTNGVLFRYLRRRRMNLRMEREHLLRGMYESSERDGPGKGRLSTTPKILFEERGWETLGLKGAVRRAMSEGLVELDGADHYALTEIGWTEAARLVREHRLWELYLITHADVAPSRVDHEADRIEHVLEPELIEELQALLAQDGVAATGMPRNPHADEPASAATTLQTGGAQ